MAEPPKRPPPVPKHASLPTLAESSVEGLPSVVVDLGDAPPSAPSGDATLILPAKNFPLKIDQAPAKTAAAPSPIGKPTPNVVISQDSTLILHRDDLAKSIGKPAAALPTAPIKSSAAPAAASPAKTLMKTLAKPIPAPAVTPAAKPPASDEKTLILSAPAKAPLPTVAPLPQAAPLPTTAPIPSVAQVQPEKSVPKAESPRSQPERKALDLRKPSVPVPPAPPAKPVLTLAPPPPPSRKQLQQRIRELIHRFDVPALLDALLSMGYGEEQIEFMSNPVLTHRGSLLEDIEFLDNPPRVLILANLGLLSGQGPIPSYFYQLLSEQRDASMTEFLWFFDNALLRQRFQGLFPERDRQVMPDWGEVKRLQLALLQLGAPVGMHWLFRQVYPELPVSIRRSIQKRRVRTEGAKLGESSLGSGCAFGGFTLVPVGGIDVRLLCEEWETPAGRPWAHVAEQRLSRLIMPALESTDLFLTVTLVFLDRQSYAKLAAQHFLGYEPIAAPPSEDQLPPAQQVILFQGEIGSNPR
jgi:hypothetical protein